MKEFIRRVEVLHTAGNKSRVSLFKL